MKARKEVTKVLAYRYAKADKAGKGVILDELCAVTGWHRSHARKAISLTVRPNPKVVKPKISRPRIYDDQIIAALVKCWACVGMISGKRLAPILPVLVPRLVQYRELDISADQAKILMGISPATIDRALSQYKKSCQFKGRSHTKPGSLLKSQIPVRTWADWDENKPGFVEIDLVGHEGGNNRGEFCFTLTMTDIATGWTETRTIKNKAHKWVIEALEQMRISLPFPLLGIDSDNGSEFINSAMVQYCQDHELTFTRSRSGNKNDGAHVEQKNWAVVRTIAGYHRYDTTHERELLNQIWEQQSMITNFWSPSQKLISKTRDGAKVMKKYDTPQTPYMRLQGYENIKIKSAKTLKTKVDTQNPIAIQRKIQNLTQQLLTITTSKNPCNSPESIRAKNHEATKKTTRAI